MKLLITVALILGITAVPAQGQITQGVPPPEGEARDLAAAAAATGTTRDRYQFPAVRVERGPVVEPKIIVKPWSTIFSLVNARRRLCSPSVPVQQLFITVHPLLLDVRRLFYGQEFRLPLRTLQWRDRTKIPNALQVRLPPWRARG